MNVTMTFQVTVSTVVDDDESHDFGTDFGFMLVECLDEHLSGYVPGVSYRGGLDVDATYQGGLD